MPARIRRSCMDSGQAVPETKGEIVRLVLESLAFKYHYTLDRLNRLTKEPVEVMHLIGGGSRNRLLNQFAANAMQVPVVAGPFEATATGNILTQMAAMGELHSLEEAREVAQRSFPTEAFLPCETERWEENYHRFLKVTGLDSG
jgi:sugar (pentulose or hexulose) kinase